MATVSMPVTMSATRRAVPGQEAELERWATRLCAAASTFPGHMSADVISGRDGQGRTVTVLLTFASASAAAHWETSTSRAELLAEASRLTSGWTTPAALTPRTGGPSRMKTAVVVWAGLTPFALLLNVLAGPALADLPLLARTLVTTVVLVPLALFVGVPLVNRALSARPKRTRR